MGLGYHKMKQPSSFRQAISAHEPTWHPVSTPANLDCHRTEPTGTRRDVAAPRWGPCPRRRATGLLVAFRALRPLPQLRHPQTPAYPCSSRWTVRTTKEPAETTAQPAPVWEAPATTVGYLSKLVSHRNRNHFQKLQTYRNPMAKQEPELHTRDEWLYCCTLLLYW